MKFYIYILFSFLALIQAQAIWPFDSYYKIRLKRAVDRHWTYYSISKPYEDGSFTVIKNHPRGNEVRLKTSDIEAITQVDKLPPPPKPPTPFEEVSPLTERKIPWKDIESHISFDQLTQDEKILIVKQHQSFMMKELKNTPWGEEWGKGAVIGYDIFCERLIMQFQGKVLPDPKKHCADYLERNKLNLTGQDLQTALEWASYQ